MSTGIIGAWSGVSSLSYTPNTAAKVNLHYNPLGNASYYARVNGVQINQSAAIGDITFWVGAGQTVLIDTTGGGNCVVSALEG